MTMLIPKNRKTGRKAPLAFALALALALSLCPVGGAAVSDAIPEADTVFTFTDQGITPSGGEDGYKIKGTDLTINAAGTYRITGACGEGSITVKKDTTGVALILEDLILSSSATAPLSLNKNTETTVYVTGANTLTDMEDPANENSEDPDVADAFEGAAIKVKGGASAVITGDGALTADGSVCKNGVKAGASAAVTVEGDVTLNVRAANNGLAADGSLTINGGTLNITAGKDGVKAEPDEGDTTSAGTVAIHGGSITLDAGGDGIQAAGALTITGGTFDITTFGGYTKAADLEQTGESAKGVKSDTQLSISGGDFTLNTADDALHSNNDLTITGGTFRIRSGDDALHADNDVSVAGADLTISACYEGIEGTRIFLESGAGTIVSIDDGLNAASDRSVNEIAIYLNGGVWTINSGGDGLDAGGNSRNNTGGFIYLNGGETVIFSSTKSYDSALDSDSSCIYRGGTVLAVGMAGMAQAPTSGLSLVFTSSSINKDTRIEIKDSAGTLLYAATAVKKAVHVVFCADGLTAGDSYTLYVNGKEAGTAVAEVSDGRVGGTGHFGGGGGGGGGSRPGGQSQQPADPQTPGGGAEQTEPLLPPPSEEPGTEEPPAAPDFIDVSPDAWYAPAVRWAKENGIMNGVGDDQFAPELDVSRGMLAQILYNMEGRPEAAGGSGFSDVAAGAWYADAVAWAEKNGIVSGYSDGAFGPGDPVTRAQTAVLLRNYARYKGEDVSASAPMDFADAGDVPAWGSDAMGWSVGKSIFQGDGDRLSPNQTASRAQIAAVMMRYLDEE